MMDLFSANNLIITGLVGMSQYWILKEFNLFLFYEQKNHDEKKYIISLLALIYYLVLGYCMTFTGRIYNFEAYYLVAYLLSAALEVCVFKCLNFGFNKFKQRELSKGRAVNNYIPILQNLIETDLKSSGRYVFITDFSNKIIEHGFINEFSANTGEIELVLVPGNWEEVETDFESFRTSIDSEWMVYVSSKDRLIFYLSK